MVVVAHRWFLSFFLILICVRWMAGWAQKTDDGQPVVGVVRPQDFALLLLQRRHAAYRLAPAAQLRHYPFGQITGKNRLVKNQ